jgi:hypothetical protein
VTAQFLHPACVSPTVNTNGTDVKGVCDATPLSSRTHPAPRSQIFRTEIDYKSAAKILRKKTPQQASKSAQRSGDNSVENIQKIMKMIRLQPIDEVAGDTCRALHSQPVTHLDEPTVAGAWIHAPSNCHRRSFAVTNPRASTSGFNQSSPTVLTVSGLFSASPNARRAFARPSFSFTCG